MPNRFDWTTIWTKFDNWLDKKEKATWCKTCLMPSGGRTSWKEQQKMIQKLVETELNTRLRQIKKDMKISNKNTNKPTSVSIPSKNVPAMPSLRIYKGA